MYDGTQGVDATEILQTTDGRYIAVNDRLESEIDGTETYKVRSGVEEFHIPQEDVEDVVHAPSEL